jgi:rhodanese-related sulfurtransferase/Tfp pilus assembly protein PilZ
LRLSAADLGRALAQRTDLVIVDVRTPAAYAASQVQAKGAMRATLEDILQVGAALARTQSLVLYCDSAGEATSARAAQLLMERGYSRVAVLTGGFAAWQAAALPLERTPHARGTPLTAPQAVLPVPSAESPPALKTQIAVDLPVGVKGEGPYFNARATALRMTGLILRTSEMLPVGQKLRLTLFLKGEPLELTGQVAAIHPPRDGEESRGIEVAFDPLGEEASTVLEGFILAHRSGGSFA